MCTAAICCISIQVTARSQAGGASQACLVPTVGQQSPWKPKLEAALKMDFLINNFIGIQEKQRGPYRGLCQGSSDRSYQKSSFN